MRHSFLLLKSLVPPAVLFFAASCTHLATPPPAPAARTLELIGVLKSDAAPDAKYAACRQLGAIGDAAAVPALAGLLADTNLAHYARIGLEPIPGPAVDAAFRSALDTLNGRLLAGVIQSVGARRDAGATGRLSKRLSDADPEVAAAAAMALGHIATPAAAEALATAPAGVGPVILQARLLCAGELLARGRNADARVLYDALRADATATAPIRAAAMAGAIRSRGRDGRSLLSACLKGGDDALFGAAMTVAQTSPDRAITRELADALPRAEPGRQALLLAVLGARGDRSALPAVLAAALSPSGELRVAALRALVQLGDPAALPCLVARTADGDPAVAQAARTALAAFPGRRADEAAVAFLDDADPAVRALGVDLIAQRRVSAAVPGLLGIASGERDAALRLAAIKAVAEVGGIEAASGLLDLLAKDRPEAEVKAAKGAVVAVGRSAADRTPCVRLLLARRPSLPPAVQTDLANMLGSMGAVGELKAVPGPDTLALAMSCAGREEWKAEAQATAVAIAAAIIQAHPKAVADAMAAILAAKSAAAVETEARKLQETAAKSEPAKK